jgi:undecaprenyl-diphosphatase
MTLSPTGLDLWIARELAGFLKHSPRFDLGVESAIEHYIFGGLWFGATLFTFWAHQQGNDQSKTKLRILTIFVGSTLAILIALLAGAIISWPPPARYPGLENLYPGYWEPNPNTNCFPSQSTAFYSSVAAGIYSIHKKIGKILWVLVGVCIALPRMYMGGHFLTDIVAGLLIGLVSYDLVRRFLEAGFITKLKLLANTRPRLDMVLEFVIFLWIVQVTVEFKDAVWLERLVISAIK